jgi:5'-phosphate synthase pdxT subunit
LRELSGVSEPSMQPDAPRSLRVGVLAIQGDYAAHVSALRKAAAGVGAPLTIVLVRKPAELETIDGLVIPGGESTTFLKFLERDGFLGALKSFASSKPTFGTCAGAILLAHEVIHPPQPSLAVLDATVERNAYGRQNDSAILHARTALGGPPLEMVFIRAPRFTRTGLKVRILAERDGFPALVEQAHLLAATFHPELSQDSRVHGYFLEKVRTHVTAGAGPDSGPSGA